MATIDFTGVLRDCLLPLTGCLGEDPWVQAFLDNEELLLVLPRLAATCKEWHDVVQGLTEFAALRMAEADFARAKKRGISSLTSQARKEDVALMLSMYERALFFLSRSWVLQNDMEERLRCTPLVELSSVELQSIYYGLQDGWGSLEIEVLAGAKLQPSSQIWVTPSHRA